RTLEFFRVTDPNNFNPPVVKNQVVLVLPASSRGYFNRDGASIPPQVGYVAGIESSPNGMLRPLIRPSASERQTLGVNFWKEQYVIPVETNGLLPGQYIYNTLEARFYPFKVTVDSRYYADSSLSKVWGKGGVW